MSSIRERITEECTKKDLQGVQAPGIGEVFLRSMSAAEFDRLMASIKVQHGGDIQRRGNWRAWLVSQVLCEADGNRVFGEGEDGFLGQLPSGTVQFLYDRFAAMNGLSKEAEEELVGNSEGMPADVSPSALHLS